MLKNILYNECNLFIEFIKLFPFMYIAFEFRLKSKKSVIICSSLVIILAAVIGVFSEIHDFPISACLCIALTILILTGRRKYIYTVITYLGISMFDMLSSSIMTLLLGYRLEAISDSFGLHLLANCISIPVILILTGIIYTAKKSNGYLQNDDIGTAYMILILIGELSVSLFITAFQLGENSDPILSICLCISGIVFLISGAAIIINHIAKNIYKSEAKINENLLKVQEKYYTMLLEKDRDTIKFRHDMNSHINCMYILFKDKKYDELDLYFEKMGAALTELRPTLQTGNALLTAILNDIASKYPQVKLEIEGSMPEDIKLSSIDICTIFSNLANNAFNAAERSADKFVSIAFKFIGSSLYCTIQNSVSKKVNIKNNMLETEKDDKKNHGLGTVNARRCAEKYHGEITFSCDEHIFAVEIVIPKIYNN